MRWKTLIPRPVRACLRRWLMPSRPFNHMHGSYSPEHIERDVDYALQVGRNYLGWIGDSLSLRGLRVLELGPGINFGSGFYLAAHGAVPAVADRFLAPWDPGYHPGFYRRLLERLRQDEPHLDAGRLAACVDAGAHLPDAIGQYRHGSEDLDLPDESVDLVISNAVLEHLYDHESALRQLCRITRPGGWNLHQVDFRYHRKWDTPLEHLLWSRERFARLSRRLHCECGTMLRPYEMSRLFEGCGFRSVEFHANEFAAPAYFAGFVGRLRRAKGSPYAATPAEELRPLGGLFKVRK
jgi:SAM-dependent methyltransferase